MIITKDHKPNFGEAFAYHSLASMAICAGLSIQPTERMVDNYRKFVVLGGCLFGTLVYALLNLLLG